MGDSQALLNKIAALRRGQEEGGPVQQLERKVSSGSRQNLVLDGSLRRLAGAAHASHSHFG